VSKRLAIWMCAALAAGTMVAACGSSSSSGGGGGGSGGGGNNGGATITGAKVIDPKSADNAKGTVSLCTGADTAGDKKAGIADFNAKYASQGVKAKLVQFPTSATDQRAQAIQRLQAKSTACDVYVADVIWTAEFASQKWIYDMTPYVQSRTSEFVPATLATAKYAGKYWGVPRSTNAGFLFYRTDQVASAPTTWQQAYQEAAQKNGIVYQGASYEGLTVNFLELAFAAGGTVLSPDGKKAAIDSPQNLKALQFMVNGIKSGAAPKEVTTYQEENARMTFEAGKATFMRNWPYAYATGQMKGSKIRNKFKVAPFPSFAGGGKAGVLGGDNLVISAYTKNPGAALKLIEFWTSPKLETLYATKYSLAPVLKQTYTEAAVKKAQPFAPQLLQAVQQAKPRPVSPVYQQISEAIYKNVNQALSGQSSPQSALKNAQSQINKALTAF
jgi:multiple sugar transport system substrate-binding protein